MAYTAEQVKKDIDQRLAKRHMARLVGLCLELNLSFSVNAEASTISIRVSDFGSMYNFKAIADDDKPYMQSGSLLNLSQVRDMLTSIIPASRALQPAYNYAFSDDE